MLREVHVVAAVDSVAPTAIDTDEQLYALSSNRFVVPAATTNAPSVPSPNRYGVKNHGDSLPNEFKIGILFSSDAPDDVFTKFLANNISCAPVLPNSVAVPCSATVAD